MSTSLIVFIFSLIVISSLITTVRKKRRYRSKNDIYYVNQLFTSKYKRENAILRSTFDKKRLFNKGEYIALRYTQKYLADNNLDYYIFPQIPLLAFLDETSSDINIHSGLRPDFVLANSEGEVVAVMEINGIGHSDKFDRSKSLILDSVDISIIEIDTSSWNDKACPYGKYVASKVHEGLNNYFYPSKQ